MLICLYFLFLQVKNFTFKNLLLLMSQDNSKESKESDYDEDEDQLEEKQEEERGEKATTNTTF
jgi:hypothetical protein